MFYSDDAEPDFRFLIFVPKEDTIELDMKVEDGIKFVISGGLVEPDQLKKNKRR